MRIGKVRLTGCEFDAATLRFMHGVADRWRSTGLAVDVTDYMPLPGEPHGYVLTASSDTTVMVLRCHRWLQRRLLRRKRIVWTISISVRQRDPAAGPEAPWQPTREVGAVAALDQHDLWDQIDAWIDGRLRPATSLAEAVSELP